LVTLWIEAEARDRAERRLMAREFPPGSGVAPSKRVPLLSSFWETARLLACRAISKTAWFAARLVFSEMDIILRKEEGAQTKKIRGERATLSLPQAGP
jgi:hypothetical protein